MIIRQNYPDAAQIGGRVARKYLTRDEAIEDQTNPRCVNT